MATAAVPYTPAESELLPNHKIPCVQPNCTAVFTNNGNYELHLLKRHNVVPPKKARSLLYHCPMDACIYHVQNGKHFKNLKYLRQHYHKVHAAKTYICGRCEKGFATAGALNTHLQGVCGRKFACHECGWDYLSRESLLTHARRKGHNIDPKYDLEEALEIEVCTTSPTEYLVNIKDNNHRETSEEFDFGTARCKLQNCTYTPSLVQQDQSTQTETVKHFRSASVQTESPEGTSMFHSTATSTPDLDDIQALLRDIETQTELSLRSPPPFNSDSNSVFIDHILTQSSNMHTQTCQDLLSEFGLTDIETQTNWSSNMHTQTCQDLLSEFGLTDIETQTNWSSLAAIGEDKDMHEYISTSTSTNCAQDEFFVSTETQTSFTQCLLDSCRNTTSTAVGGDSGFGGLTTQHTQTCETLLAGLFDLPESELIGGLQSSYTQT